MYVFLNHTSLFSSFSFPLYPHIQILGICTNVNNSKKNIGTCNIKNLATLKVRNDTSIAISSIVFSHKISFSTLSLTFQL